MKPVYDLLPTLPFPSSNIFTPQIRISGPPVCGGKPSPSTHPHQPTTLLRNSPARVQATASPPSPARKYPDAILPFFCSLPRLASLFYDPPDIRWKNRNSLPPLTPSPFLPLLLHHHLGFNTFMSTCPCLGSTS